MAQEAKFKLSEEARAIMACVDSYEQADVTTKEDLSKFLATAPKQTRPAALAEVVRVDVERRRKQGERTRIVGYLKKYPALRESAPALLELLQDEYERRVQGGEQPSLEEYREALSAFHPRGSGASVETSRGALETRPLDTPKPSQPAQPTVARDRVGKYRLGKTLGEGGFGVVYQGHDEQLERNVAIKVRRRGGGPGGLSADLLNEARSIARLDHPNIVKLIEVGETAAGDGYVVYELVEGKTLSERIKAGDFDHAQAADWTAQVADALHYAHKRDIIHRDIKPANILIDLSGRAKVVDFGLARRDDSFFVDDSNQVLGTLSYLSPEQASRKAHWASSQSDIYSLGVVLYELLCRRRPFQSKKMGELLEQVRLRTPPPPRSIDDTIPKPLEDICLKALSKAPEGRFRTGVEMASALRAAVAPREPWVARVVQYAAALVMACALGALAYVWMAPVRPIPPGPVVESPIKIVQFKVQFSRDGKRARDIESEDLPLRPTDRISEVNVSLNEDGYGYIVRYDHQGGGELLWPSRNQQHPIEASHELIYSPTSPLTLGDVDNASMIMAIVGRQPLSDQQIEAITHVPLKLVYADTTDVVSAEDASHIEQRFKCTNSDDAQRDDISVRGLGAQIRIPQEFKNHLKSFGDSYCGWLISHEKQQTGEKQ